MCSISSRLSDFPAAVASVSDTKSLDSRDRPEGLKMRIASAFAYIAENTSSKWGLYNGSSRGYALFRADEYGLMESIVRKAPPEQTDFYALDIGCGNFQWGTGLAKHFDELTDLPRPFTLHILNVRGEKYLEEPVSETSRCKLYKLGAFKIEELFEQFKSKGLDLENKVDLIVSRWAFRHLADPVGTFSQAYDLLRPGSGILSIDGFFSLDSGDVEDIKLLDYNERMVRLFLDTKARFLFRPYEYRHSLGHFMLQRPDASKCELPMKYAGLHDVDYKWDIGSRCITVFSRVPQAFDHKERLDLSRYLDEHPGESVIQGDQSFYESLKQNGIIDAALIVPFYTSDLPK